MQALIGLLMILVGFGVFFFCWAKQCMKISKEADRQEAVKIANDMLRNAVIRVHYKTIITDEMNKEEIKWD